MIYWLSRRLCSLSRHCVESVERYSMFSVVQWSCLVATRVCFSLLWVEKQSVLFFSPSVVLCCDYRVQKIHQIYISKQALILWTVIVDWLNLMFIDPCFCKYNRQFVSLLYCFFAISMKKTFIIFHYLTIHELVGRMYVTGCCWSPLIFPQDKHRCFHSPSFVSWQFWKRLNKVDHFMKTILNSQCRLFWHFFLFIFI